MAQTDVVTRVKSSVAALFRRDAPEGDAEASPPAAAPAKPLAAKTAPDVEFLTRLRGIVVESGAPVQAGRINFIGLDRAKERLGDRWPQVASRAQSIARATIERYLQPDDIYVAHGDNYVIAFASLDVAQAQLRCQLIARMIEQTLFGEESCEGLSVATAVATLDGNVVLKELPSLDTMIAWQAVEPAPEPDAMKTAREPSVTDDQFQVHWRPVWDARHGILAIYHARLKNKSGGAPPPANDVEAWLGHDQRLRDLAIGSLEQRVREDKPQLIHLPVQFETVAPLSRRRPYLGELSQAQSEQGKKFLLLGLMNVPAGIPSSRLQDIGNALRGHCRALVVRFSTDVSDLRAAKVSGVNSLGCDLPERGEAERALFGRIQQFGRAADQAGIANRFISGIHSLSLATAAINAGFTHLSGSLIGKDADAIGDVKPFDLGEVYRSLL